MFNDLQDSRCRCTPAVQAIRDTCAKYKVTKPTYFADAQAIFDDRIYSIPTFVELTAQLGSTRQKRNCLTHNKKHETEATRSNGLVFE